MTLTKIVITGGPGAGKTTGLTRIQEAFSNRGYTVLFVPETATEFITGGVAPWTCATNLEYQKCQMKLQLEKERLFEQAARGMKADKILLVCDRGALDNRAYMNDEEFAEVLRYVGKSEGELRDSYDAVFHLVTAAKGAATFYTTANNSARIESVEQAAALDDKIIAAWSGHPHLRIIDNATDFEVKMKRLIAEITTVLGEPLPFDVERKFLIQYPDLAALEALPNCKKINVMLTYLKSDKGDEVRIRQRGNKGNFVYYETRKKTVDGQRVKIDRRLTKDEYLDLLMDADPATRPVRKVRYCFTDGNQYYDIDIYPFWKDQAILKIELSDPEEEIRFPKVLNIIREVTDDPAYKNYSLAKI